MAKIVFLISSMDVGGAEQVLRQVALNAASTEKPGRVILACLYQGGKLAEGLEEKGIKIYEGIMKNRFDLIGLVRFVKILKAARPDILYISSQALSQAAGIIGAMFVKIGAKILAMHSHEFEGKKLYRFIMDKISISLSEKIVCVSESQKKGVIKIRNADPGKIKVIYNGVDINKFRPAPKTDTSGRVTIGTVGSLRREKGLDILLKAAQEVLMQCPSAFFVIVGEGKERNLLQDMAVKLGIEDNVSFLGERSDVEKIIPCFDIACSSSRTETFPLVILEYMSCGVPVVATSVGGVPEMVNEGVNGMLAKSECPSELAEKLVRMIRDKKMRESMVINARKTVEERFTLDKMTESYKDLFKEINK